jgi:hypothetical protein
VTIFYNPASVDEYYVQEDGSAKRMPYFFIGFAVLILAVLMAIHTLVE